MTANCPVCEGNINLPITVEVTELITCGECANQFEVALVDKTAQKVNLKEAPKIEEDWGQ